ncbi:histidine kinase [Curvibacter sp. APW13]|uniref:sensor histidine kinase n=1 Tax=Curvibacter sp. APW13 TaxID=3077236 RepID=UPI0028DFD4F8|nr:histidine kinase [Curvibacter sp. APW13]MDT8990905.1 histidine kinase [Curvibacter sp. APW13]
MRDTQILSVFPEPSGANPAPERKPSLLVFDACHTGVVLRAVLFVEVCVGIAMMYPSTRLLDWMFRFSLATGAALPATLAWLLAACLAKRLLGRQPFGVQLLLASLLGGLCAAYGSFLLWMAGLLEQVPWSAVFASGAWLSLLLVAGLWMRAKGRTPAATAAQLAELQARIRPHFLFNTLNSAIALVRTEPAKAEALLEDLSDLFRQALRDPNQTVSLSQEIDLARRYLAIEQVRFGQRLRVQWDLDPAAERAQLPSLVLQPLVENAVRHGVEPSDTGADVRVSTQRRGSAVVIKVTNTVPGGQGVAGHGVALQSVKERIALMHDVQGQVRSGMKDGLFQVRIEVPL